ncbi:MAG: GAF domain-containing protein [Flavobacteriales bacterium]|nr:GAF domain-containing protein [Flavobacteriales bacterium]
MDDSINLLEELNNISKIHTLSRDDIDNLMIEFARRVLTTLKLERMSVWIFNEDRTEIVSIGEYDLPTHQFTKDSHLKRENYPSYFKAISENKILLVENVHTNPQTIELDSDYSAPNNVISLMDIPMRLEGELIGVMCFEKTGQHERVFSKKEQVFALSIAIVFASNLEARYRRALQARLDEELKEKTILLNEIHHRVKNNLSVVSSLVHLQSYKAKDSFHESLFEECRTKIDSIASIHEIIYKTRSYSKIDLKLYFDRLLEELATFYSTEDSKITLHSDICKGSIELEQALPLALILNEVITNSYKHAFEDRDKGEIKVTLKMLDHVLVLEIKDDGIGIKDHFITMKSLGMEIIDSLTEQLEGKRNYTAEQGTRFVLEFPVKVS